MSAMIILITWTGISIPVSLAVGHLLRRVSSDYPRVVGSQPGADPPRAMASREDPAVGSLAVAGGGG